MNVEQPIEILLVEDNPHDVELTLHALRKHHVSNSIKVARDGAEALALMFPNGSAPPNPPPKLVLLDLKLPKISGVEVLRRIKSDSRTRSVPVVVLTSSREDRDILECYKEGVNSYIVKPVDFDQFTEAVRAAGLYWILVNQPPSAA